MKKLILLLLVLIPMALMSQTSISCENAKKCIWDESIQDFTECQYFEMQCLFKFNKTETIITHVTQ